MSSWEANQVADCQLLRRFPRKQRVAKEERRRQEDRSPWREPIEWKYGLGQAASERTNRTTCCSMRTSSNSASLNWLPLPQDVPPRCLLLAAGQLLFPAGNLLMPKPSMMIFRLSPAR